ncbi:allograft inflammatory factor 1-like [Lytechinus variegatus]|uniref:allograft inflammatory factor 1-like n=1 Tax=Lytechinus variegatus TaxID=7654 RepID=UPI001BB1AF83|nr:allograft inflammatory factor 1-like [Lytechinus variegatus]
MPRTTFDRSNVQGGKDWGRAKQIQEENIDVDIEAIIRENDYKDVEDLEEQLQSFKAKFMLYDLDANGVLDEVDVSHMMEKLGQPKNQIEIRKMIKEIDLNNSGNINFTEFVTMMLGKKNSIMRVILMFEEKNKPKEKPTGLPPKKSFADLP